jgi:hypothetical protein
MPEKRVLVIVNKWWECDPVCSVLLNANAAPRELWPVLPIGYPRQRPDKNKLPAENPVPQPRLIYELTNTRVEVWCISDLLEHLPDIPKFQSSTEQKATILPKIFKGDQPALVIAVGTAGYPQKYTQNGSVTVGTRTFIHNPHSSVPNVDSNWVTGPFDRIIDSSLSVDMFDKITSIEPSIPTVIDRFILPPMNPVASGDLLARHNFVCLGSVNVTDYTEYTKTDLEAVKSFGAVSNILVGRSLETTHGLIRVQSDAPFMFVSGITDRVGHFDDEVGPRAYAQNTAAAHNAGVIIAWMLPRIDEALV